MRRASLLLTLLAIVSGCVSPPPARPLPEPAPPRAPTPARVPTPPAAPTPALSLLQLHWQRQYGLLALELSRRVERPVPGGVKTPAMALVHPPAETPGPAATADEAQALWAQAQAALAEPLPADAVAGTWSALSRACRAHRLEACELLRTTAARPVVQKEPVPGYPLEARRRGASGMVEFSCQLTPAGRVTACQPTEAPHPALVDAALVGLRFASFQPARFAGHAVDWPLTYSFAFVLDGHAPRGADPWAWVHIPRERVRRFPESRGAAQELAQELSKTAPASDAHAKALTELTRLTPENPWAWSELARLLLARGQLDEAVAAADRAWGQAPFDPYVLEVYAATLAATGRCGEAREEQQRALALLPRDWLSEERARFAAVLRTYSVGCGARTGR